MSAEERRKILVEYFAKRRHRRDKPAGRSRMFFTPSIFSVILASIVISIATVF